MLGDALAEWSKRGDSRTSLLRLVGLELAHRIDVCESDTAVASMSRTLLDVLEKVSAAGDDAGGVDLVDQLRNRREVKRRSG